MRSAGTCGSFVMEYSLNDGELLVSVSIAASTNYFQLVYFGIACQAVRLINTRLGSFSASASDWHTCRADPFLPASPAVRVPEQETRSNWRYRRAGAARSRTAQRV